MSKMPDPKVAIIEIINRVVHGRKADIVENVGVSPPIYHSVRLLKYTESCQRRES